MVGEPRYSLLGTDTPPHLFNDDHHSISPQESRVEASLNGHSQMDYPGPNGNNDISQLMEGRSLIRRIQQLFHSRTREILGDYTPLSSQTPDLQEWNRQRQEYVGDVVDEEQRATELEFAGLLAVQVSLCRFNMLL